MNVLPLRSFYLYKVLRLFFVRSGGGIVIEPSRTRQNMRIDVPRPHIEFFKRTFNYIGPLWFNDLPEEIFYMSYNLNQFSRELKKFLLNLGKAAI